MQILEVKSDIAKIIYNPVDNRLLPSDFLLIEDSNQKLIAQIINIETTDKTEENLAILRLALSIDKDDNLSYFNGYIPSKTSKLIYITPEEIIELVEGSDKNIYLGNLSNHSSCFVKTSMSYVDDRLYIQSDRNDKTQIVIENLVSELRSKNKKVVIIDFNGQYSSASDDLKLKISENIKLPLNIEAFDTILQYDTTDCPIEDKAVIQSIVLELREYMQTLKDKYIPFDMFKNVVAAEFESNPVSGLMLLRNKLWMYAQDGIFANKKEEFDVIDSTFFNQNIIIVDASDVEEKWFKFIIQTVLQLTNHESYLFLSLNDIEIDKKSIVSLYNKPNIIPVVSTSYDNPYRPILKSLCKNHLLCKPSVILNEQEYYSPLLNRMNIGDFIAYGETTLNLPLIIELQQFNSNTQEDVTQNEIKRDVDKLLSSPQTVIPKTNGIVQDDISEDLPELDGIDSYDDIQELESLDDIAQGEIVLDAPVDDIVDDMSQEMNSESVENSEEEEKLLDFAQEPVPDDEFKDSDFDFLDEVSEQEESDDDILNVPFELSYDNRSGSASMLAGSNYGVFTPLAEDLNENSTFIEKISAESVQIVEETELVVIEDNIDDLLDDIPTIDSSAVQNDASSDSSNNQIKDLPDDILLEDVEDNSGEAIEHIDDIDVLSDDLEIISDVNNDLVEDNLEIIPESSELQIIDDLPVQDNNIPSVDNIQQEETVSGIELIDDKEAPADDSILDELLEVQPEDEKVDLDEELSSIEDVIENIENKMDETSQSEENQKEVEIAEEETQVEQENIDTVVEKVVVLPPPPVDVKKEVPPPIKENIVSREEPKNIPIYETDIPDENPSYDVPFQVGDRVYHPKHGNGVIEAFSSYSNRILFCHILFDNVGRKIMDPRVSCIEKLS